MYLGDIYEALSIKNNVSIIKYKIFTINSKLGHRLDAKLFI